MRLIPTELNHRLAGAVRYSVSADRFYIAGKAGFWRLVGVGLVAFAIGSALGLGFYGFSYVTRPDNFIGSKFACAAGPDGKDPC